MQNYKISAFGLAKKDELVSQDSFGVRVFEDLVIGVVCDGVGSAKEAKNASKRVVDYMISSFKQAPKSWDIQKSIKIFINNINSILYKEGIKEYNSPEFVTTLSLVIIQGNRLYGANVGDSPIYLLREDNLSKLSFDHTLEKSHILTQAIGLDKEIEPYIFENFIKEKDTILLCSDGLSEVLEEKEIKNRLKYDASSIVKYACNKVKDYLLDDASAVVIKIESIDKKNILKKLDLKIPKSLKKEQIIDGYKLIKPLSKNKRTWLVYKKDRYYVMKFPPIEAIFDQELLDLFIKEAWNASRLKAGFFPKAVIPKNRSFRYYIMEYIEGKNLKEAIKKRALKIEEAISLAKFLIKSSKYLLKYNLVHGDIKPENIIVYEKRGKKEFKLVDFGSIVEIFSITNKAGTPSYLAPERFKNESINESTEIFAIGVTLYEVLTKKYPYGEIEPFSNPIFKKAKRIKELNQVIPEWFEAVILRAIEIDKTKRYQHYSQMDYELNNSSNVKPYFDPNAPLIEREPLKVYKSAFIISFLLNILLIFLLLK